MVSELYENIKNNSKGLKEDDKFDSIKVKKSEVQMCVCNF